MTVYSRIFRGLQLARRRRAANEDTYAPTVMNDGELIYDVNTNRFYFGGPDGLPIAINTSTVDPEDIGAVSSSDARLYNQRVPTDGSVTNAKISEQGIDATHINDLAVVATSGSYADLSNKPTIPSAYTLSAATSSVLGGIKIGTGLSIDNNGVVTAADSYTLPAATASVLGGVKQGSNVTISVDGTLSVAAPVTSLAYSAITGTPILATVATSGSYADLSNKPTIPSAYSLPVATSSVLGGVKQGANVTIGADGTISVSPAGTYTLPVATAGVLGGVKQGSNVTIGVDGVISVAAPVTSLSYASITGTPTLATVATSGSYADLSNKPTIPSAYSLPTATASVLGGIKIGSGLAIDGSGVVTAAGTYTLPAATTSVLGGMIVGTGLGVSSGTVSVTYGTTSNTTCQGNDSRLSDARTPTSHVHGNITNAGAIGSTSGLPVITTTSGVLTVGAFGVSAGQFCQGNDARLSDARTPTSHAHGNITNVGAIGVTSGLPIITTTSGVLTAGAFGTSAGQFCQGNDSRLADARTPTSHVHGNITNAGVIGSTSGQVVVTTTGGLVTTTATISATTQVSGLATVATSGSYADLLSIPSTFTPASHTQDISTVNGLQTALDGKQASTVTLAPPQITANQNNYAPGSCDVLVLTADAARNITGFTPATAGSSGFLTIINTGSFVITLKYQSTSSLATARMNTTYLADYNLEAGGGSALLWYDATSQFWRIL
jgi:hypothetical protein